MKGSMAHIRSGAFSLLFVLCTTLCAGCIQREDREGDGYWSVVFLTGTGTVEVRCEPALTEEERRNGLMGRDSLEEGTGMVFVFDPPQNASFWMKDTKLALDIVFIDPTGNISSIASLEPGWGLPDSEVPSCVSPGPVSFVVEVQKGFCLEQGISVGHRAEVVR